MDQQISDLLSKKDVDQAVLRTIIKTLMEIAPDVYQRAAEDTISYVKMNVPQRTRGQAVDTLMEAHLLKSPYF